MGINRKAPFFLEVARGRVEGHSSVYKFGANHDIAASSTEDIVFGGLMNWLTVATAIRVKSGGNAADIDSTGVGARTITVIGLDENWNEVEEDIALAGANASTLTTITFIRVFRAYVKTTGTYTGVNTGDITIENGTGGTTLVIIGAGKGQTETSKYTVPAGKTAYITRLSAEVDAAKAVDLSFWQRKNADIVSAPFTAKRIVSEFHQLIGQATLQLDAFIEIPEKTDLWWSGSTGAGNAAGVEVDYDLILVVTP